MACRQRAMKELGRVTFPPDTGGLPRVSLSERERIIFVCIFMCYMKTERTRLKNEGKHIHIHRETKIETGRETE